MRSRVLFFYILLFLPLLSLATPTYFPLEFVQNKGQWEGPFLYKAEAENVAVFLENNCITYKVGDIHNAESLHQYKHGMAEQVIMKYHAYKVRFLNTTAPESIETGKTQQHYYNYYLGNDPKRWQSEIHPHLNIDYKNIYQGVDIHFSSENSQLKYDFIVHPGADASTIALQFEGADDLRLKKNNLIIKTSVGDVEELKPYAYQYIDGQRHEVTCLYHLQGNVITYYFPDGYNKTQTLIIDPTVVFSTLTGSSADNWGFTATFDPQGDFYGGGAVNATTGSYPLFPSTGAIQNTWGGGTGTSFPCDMAISKFNATGTNMIYSTYFGGSDNDQPHSMVVDQSNNLIIAGRSYSSDYPVSSNAYDNSHNGAGTSDIVVTKFNAAGTAVLGSTYVGGSGDDGVNITANYGIVNTSLKHSYGDEARSEVLVDNNGNVYVASCTRSTNFPKVNATQSTLNGNQDGVVIKLNSGLTALTWSTYLGGDADDAAYALAFDNAQNNVFVAGGTGSNNSVSNTFPVTAGSYQSAYRGGIADGFIAKFQNSGSYTLSSATYIGGVNNYDQCFGIQVDNNDFIYAMGQTLGGQFPVSPTTIYSNNAATQFIIKLDNNLSSSVYSTVFGSPNASEVNISPVAFLVDTCENVYISGWGGDLALTGSSTSNMPVSSTATSPLKTTTDGHDFYFAVFSKDIAGLLFGGYLGRNTTSFAEGEHVDGGTSRFNKNGEIYQAICGACGIGSPGFPTTAGSFAPNKPSGTNCNLAAVKIQFNLGAVKADFTVSPDTVICLGDPVTFTDNSANAATWEWDFGDGTTSTTQSPTHTYTQAGTYQVRLIVRNPIVCIVVDTAYTTIRVDSTAVQPNFDVTLIDSCGPYTASFNNTSNTNGVPGPTTYTWRFGDGTTFTGANPPIHNFPDTGSYTITLIMSNNNACKSPDSISKTIFFNNQFLKAEFEGPDVVCQFKDAMFTNKSLRGDSYLWNFGDGDTSTAFSPTHTFDSTGSYTITLFAFNPNSCNKVDSFKRTITIKSLPIANFTFSPAIPETNTPITFTNLSVNAVEHRWDFGDGTGSNDRDPAPHLYRKTGSYDVCLVVRSQDGCVDTMCRSVSADISPLADLPTGFSPNGDGSNDILYVRGAAIETMNLKIFNRWGQLIFESNEQSIGWDGTYKGKPQAMEAYGFTLNVTFIDGTTLSKTGNVTLLR